MALRLKIGLIFIILALITFNVRVNGRPRDEPLSRSECDENDDMQVTCQKCAKFTKSPLVYPMCCNNEDGVFTWCRRYVYYGIN